MTTIDAAAASGLYKRLAFAALATVLAAGLSACGTSSDLLGSSSSSDNSQMLAAPAAQQPVQPASRIAIAPVIGAPEAVAKQITTQLGQDLGQKRVAVANNPTDHADYTLRGYVVAAREKAGVKVSYIWDLTDATGKRVNRITGEELVGNGEARDPWASVTPSVMQSISNKTATQLSSWLSAQPQAAAVAAAGQQMHTSSLPSGGGATLGAPATPAAATTTGSIGRDGGVSAMVPSVTGAPGDGSTSLTSALRNELSRNGVALSERPGGPTYRVEGKVKVGQSKDGKQPIQIDWFVKDPTGKQIGTVSQKNEIPEGSLDGNWGQVADAAASAAAQGILKLLPGAKATN